MQHQDAERFIDIANCANIEQRNSDEQAAQHGHNVGNHRQARLHDDNRQQFRHDEKFNRIQANRRQRVHFFRDDHGADFGGKRRAAAPGDDNGGDERREFARHRDADEIGDVNDRAERTQHIRALQR